MARSAESRNWFSRLTPQAKVMVTVVVMILLAGAASWAYTDRARRTTAAEIAERMCGSGVERIDGQCIGVTDGSYLFDPAFAEIQKKIADENARVRTETSSYVTVALVDLLTPTETSAKSTENVRHELEGAYTAQRRINESILPTSSIPQIQLVLANWGSTEKQWRQVAGQLVEMTGSANPLVAVIGLGVSTAETQHRAEDLSSHGIPMVGSLLTAKELNHTEIPGFIRVSPTTLDYAKALRRYVDNRNFGSAVLVYDANSDSGGDLYTRSLKEDLEQQMQHLIDDRPPLLFFGASIPSEAGPGRFDIVTPNICSLPTDVVLYAGRRVDLGGFLDSLADRQCRSTPLTVITAADIGEVLSEREQQLSGANLTVVHAGTSDAEGWGRNVEGTPQQYRDFLMAFKGLGFDGKNLVDGQAIQMHDALRTAAQAVQLATPVDSSPSAAKVRGVLLNLNGVYQVPGAGGTLSFSPSQPGAGDPLGKSVPVLEFSAPHNDPFGKQVVTPVYVTCLDQQPACGDT